MEGEDSIPDVLFGRVSPPEAGKRMNFDQGIENSRLEVLLDGAEIPVALRSASGTL
jgi:hypothetical protein